MNKVYIFGDSFFTQSLYRSNSWPDMIAKKYHVVNAAQLGASIYDIYLQFLRHYKNITKNDTVILGWSDPWRYYSKPEIPKNEELSKLYYTQFYNQDLESFYQESIMNEVNRRLKEKEIRALFFWSFPTGYWVDTVIQDLDHNSYIYKTEFENEVRPALIYFSKTEAAHCKTEKEIINFFKNDLRPNHLSSQKIHDELYNIVTDFIDQKIQGQIDLFQRVNDGS